MPFTVGNRSPERVHGDFQIEAAPGYMPSSAERAALDIVVRAVEQLAEQAAADAKARMRPGLLAARAAFRSAQVADLRAVADGLADGTLDADAAMNRGVAIAARITTANPDLRLDNVTPARFDGEFAVTIVNYVPDSGEQAYLDQQKELIDDLAADEAADASAGYSEAGLHARRAYRTEALARLKENFTYWKEGLASDVAAGNVSFVRGYHAARRARLGRQLFTVSPERGRDAEADYNVAIQIRIARDLPAPQNEPSPEQRELYVDINKAETIIGSVCRQIRARAHRRVMGRPAEDIRGLRLLGEYIDKLVGIAQVGLEGPHTTLAKLALNSLREEFVAREAQEILNGYVRRLGAWAGGFAVVFLVVYILVRNYACPETGPCTSWWDVHRSFLLAAAGASVGTWASFSVRQINLTFEQLAAPEEVLLDAPLRVIFVVVLTMAACLLFWTGAINVKIGDLNTEASWFSKTGTVAILIGFFCGLSERALSSAIAGRATAFVSGIAGSR